MASILVWKTLQWSERDAENLDDPAKGLGKARRMYEGHWVYPKYLLIATCGALRAVRRYFQPGKGLRTLCEILERQCPPQRR
jgi:hypothetical protein